MANLSFQGQGAVITGTVAVDLASIDAAAVGEKEITIASAVLGDIVVLVAPAAGLTAGLVIGDARVSEAGKVKVRVFNGSAAPIDEGSKTFGYILIRA